jgi:hypothetical protein
VRRDKLIAQANSLPSDDALIGEILVWEKRHGVEELGRYYYLKNEKLRTYGVRPDSSVDPLISYR